MAATKKAPTKKVAAKRTLTAKKALAFEDLASKLTAAIEGGDFKKIVAIAQKLDDAVGQILDLALQDADAAKTAASPPAKPYVGASWHPPGYLPGGRYQEPRSRESW